MVTRTKIDGFEIVQLANEDVAISIIPDLGAKICSLTNLKTGREWMWAPHPGPVYFRNNPGDPFPEGTKVGADECFPSVAECTWRDVKIEDHGEAWTRAWTLDESCLEQGKMVTRLPLSTPSLEIERAVSLGSTGDVRLAYSLTNTGKTEQEYLWALHPMMAIEEGDRLILPEECTQGRLDATVINCGLGELGTMIEWPKPAPGMRLDQLDFGRENAAVKFFTNPLQLGVAALRNDRTGDYVAFSCDVRELNTFGVWINRGGWGGYHHVAIEPTNGAPDALDIAVKEWKRYSVLAPGETAEWCVNIHVGVDSATEGETFLRQFARQ